MYLVYENDLGRIDMSGGGDGSWRITDITGLELAPKNINTVVYAGQDGQDTLSETTSPRTITIGGDIKNSGQGQYELSKALRVLNAPGVLKLYLEAKERSIKCRCNSFEVQKRNGAVQPFILQLIADKPHFEDLENTIIAIFKEEGNLNGTFTLPCVFTIRTSIANIMNLGDIKTEPIIYIYNISGGTGTPVPAPAPPQKAGFEINNKTTGQSINLLYSSGPDEVVKIDIANRKITSDKPTASNNYGNLINYISYDTFLNAFWLNLGINSIEVLNHNERESINAICEFSNRYIEAVI